MSAILWLLLAAAPIRIEPPQLAFGPAEASIEFLAPEAAALRVSLPGGGGAVSAVAPAGPGRFRLQFTFPAERFPQVVLLRVDAQTGAGAKSSQWIALPLVASTNLKIETKPGAKVTATIGDATFGPAVADAFGRATVPARVLPGFSSAKVTAIDRAGNTTTTALELPVAPFVRAVAVLPAGVANPDQEAELEVFAIEPDGSPLSSSAAKLRVKAQLGSCAPPVARGNGAFTVAYQAPKSIGSGRDTVTLGFDGSRMSTLEVPLRAGRPARVEVALTQAEYIAGSGARIGVLARVTDATGNPVPGGSKPLVTTDFGRLANDQLEVPDLFAGRTQARLHATADSVEGEAALPLRSGPPATARLVMPGTLEAGASVEGTLVVSDTFGNPVQLEGAVAVVSSSGRLASLQSAAEGSYAVGYDAAKEDPPGPLSLEVRAGERALAREELSLLPYQRAWAVLAGAFVSGNWNLTQAQAVSVRIALGLRLGRSPFELGAEGAFGYYPLVEGARTTDGFVDGSIESRAWWLALVARYSIPINRRLSAQLSFAAGGQQTTSFVGIVGAPRTRDTSWGPLVRGGAGVGVHFFGGRLLVQVEYGYAAAMGGRVRGNLGGLGASLGFLASL